MAYNRWAIALSPHLELQIVMRNMQAMVYADINCLVTAARFREKQYKNQETKKVKLVCLGPNQPNRSTPDF